MSLQQAMTNQSGPKLPRSIRLPRCPVQAPYCLALLAFFAVRRASLHAMWHRAVTKKLKPTIPSVPYQLVDLQNEQVTMFGFVQHHLQLLCGRWHITIYETSKKSRLCYISKHQHANIKNFILHTISFNRGVDGRFGGPHYRW